MSYTHHLYRRMKIYFYYEIKPCQPGARWLLSKLNTTSTNYSNCIKNFVAVGFFVQHLTILSYSKY
jgi:hypothetical protein